nr:hypothetical protein GCM10020185_18980 [Pseudomonas brassicacearum subsp. brassicacearum]
MESFHAPPIIPAALNTTVELAPGYVATTTKVTSNADPNDNSPRATICFLLTKKIKAGKNNKTTATMEMTISELIASGVSLPVYDFSNINIG